MADRDQWKPRHLARVGFTTTPSCWDDVIQQFLSVVPQGVGAMQRVLHIPAYEYELAQRSKNFHLQEEAAQALADSKCDVVGQIGTNWVHAGGTSPDDIRRMTTGISERIGVPFLMAGLCIVNALNSIGAKRITVANGYYREDWKAGINRFLEQAGFEVLAFGNLVDQGIYASLEEMKEVEAATHWDYPAADVARACILAHEAAPEADAIVQTGSGFRTLPVIEAVEGIADKPLVASDVALFWAILQELKLDLPVTQSGMLLNS